MRYCFYFGLIISFLLLKYTPVFSFDFEDKLEIFNQIVKEINEKTKLILENRRIKNFIKVKN